MMLCQLATELLANIFSFLDFKSLITCQEVCKLFKQTIQDSTALQYKIELAVCGMDDGPPSPMTTAERLKRLEMHQKAWNDMAWNLEEAVDVTSTQAWELYGGVFAQVQGASTIAFTQLPSQLRGIQKKSWVLNDLHIPIYDFTMDPTQDLLVIVEPPEDSNCRIHLLSLSTGDSHSTAVNPATLDHPCYAPELEPSTTIRICADFLGIHFNVIGDPVDHKLVIWNWKTGAIEIAINIGTVVGSFAFLSESHILFTFFDAIVSHTVSLHAVNFRQHSNQPIATEDLQSDYSLQLPRGDRSTVYASVFIYADPAPNWKPHSNAQVPFHLSRDERLFVISFTVVNRAIHSSFSSTLFVPSNTILRYLEEPIPSNGTGNRRVVPWSMWGPHNTRLTVSPRNSWVWVCFVYGMSFVTINKNTGNHPRYISVYDFNQLAFRRDLLASAGETAGHLDEADGHKKQKTMTYIQAETIMHPSMKMAFIDDLTTFLPYRCRTLCSPQSYDDRCRVMLSEDSVILVRNDGSNKQDVFTF